MGRKRSVIGSIRGGWSLQIGKQSGDESRGVLTSSANRTLNLNKQFSGETLLSKANGRREMDATGYDPRVTGMPVDTRSLLPDDERGQRSAGVF